jgi:excisionase family DNA binding protein
MARDHVAPERPLTPAMTAELFGVDAKTICRWANAGKLPALRTIGGHHRFDPAEMRRILAATRTGPTEPSTQSVSA